MFLRFFTFLIYSRIIACVNNVHSPNLISHYIFHIAFIIIGFDFLCLLHYFEVKNVWNIKKTKLTSELVLRPKKTITHILCIK